MKKVMRLMYIAALGAILATGCANKGTEGNDPDPEEAEAKVEQATHAMENEMFVMLNSLDDVDDPSELDADFSTANTMYKEALAADPDNQDANFGAAFTELLLLANDDELDSTMSAWVDFMDTLRPFQKTIYQPVGLTSLKPGAGTDNFPSPVAMVAKAAAAHAVSATMYPYRVGVIQSLIERKVIPKINYAVQCLEKLDDDASYTFMVTPKMQGDVSEDSVELDKTEICMFLTGAYALKAFANLITAYDFDMTGYDSAAIATALAPGSDFATLKAGGSAKMSDAKSALLSAVGKLEAGLNYYKTETDNQDNDLIKFTARDLQEVDSVLAHTGDVEELLGTGYTFTEDWDQDVMTPKVALTFKLGAWFDTPISDFKALIPTYSVEVVSDSSSSASGRLPLSVGVSVSADDYYWYYYDVYDSNRSDWGSLYNSDLDLPAITAKMDSLAAAWNSDPAITSFSIWTDVYEYIETGAPATLDVLIRYEYETSGTATVYHYPSITWTADTFSEWVLPDPTLGGLLPGITSDAMLKSTFGITEDGIGWTKTIP